MAELISQAVQFQIEEDPAIAIWDSVRDIIDQVQIGGADLMVCVWEPPEFLKTAGGLLLTDNSRREYVLQGCTGLVLKLGPHAYNYEKTKRWFLSEEVEEVDDRVQPPWWRAWWPGWAGARASTAKSGSKADNPKVNDWVVFAYNQGASLKMRRQSIRLISDQYILAKIPRPDLMA